jgi:chromosome segregation ATPase
MEQAAQELMGKVSQQLAGMAQLEAHLAAELAARERGQLRAEQATAALHKLAAQVAALEHQAAQLAGGAAAEVARRQAAEAQAAQLGEESAAAHQRLERAGAKIAELQETKAAYWQEIQKLNATTDRATAAAERCEAGSGRRA